ncbi:hypothetical protein [Streptomyces antimicrobicus]|uniref:Integral membrane protein n=1 Tax=Streptomyces antimicrobicus TaxID=2883108 RepID=A0ABS8B7W9_9ACTN|nr:hypothetical protein [Streptomyces antimicrobicus]MCB5180700.1 hypothetical protein [Streptomyces antimicrobicus]
MRAFRAFSVTAAAALAVGLGASFATANPSGGGGGPTNIAVNPFRVHQGSTMQVSANGCGRGGTVRSHGNFDPTLLSPGSTNYATVRIYNHAAPGIHTLQVQCNDSSLIGTHKFQILSGNGAQGGLGGSLGPSTAETAIGAGLIGVAALGAGIHLKRRHRAARGRV